VAQAIGQCAEVESATTRHPLALALVERGVEDAGIPLPDQQRQAPLDLAAATVRRTREVAPQRQLSQEHEHAVGKQVSVARAEGALFAKEVGDDAVGGMLETQHAMHELGLRLEQGGRMHARIILARFTTPPSRRDHDRPAPPEAS
jgi:hypothetical protein